MAFGRFPFAALLLVVAGLHAQTAASPRAASSITLPFVGCPSDGQVGPLPAPKGESESVAVSAGEAERLAYYRAEYGIGILAPRGWHCFSTYGSNGSNLYVAPEPINSAELFSTSWQGFSGWAIQASFMDGGTSGRFGVARIIARVFPADVGFVHDVESEGIEPASSFPAGPYPADKLRYVNDRIVEFQTPAAEAGLGTDSRLARSDGAIFGTAVLLGDREPSLVLVSMRLSPEDEDLIRPILRKAEADATKQSKQ